MSCKYFGTDGIRGVYGSELMTPGFVNRVGRALGQMVAQSSMDPMVAIGRDTRESSPLLERALSEGLRSSGVRVESVGVMPTAAVSWLTVVRRAAAGVMISASHNPWQDNGIKIFGPKGRKLTDAQELQLEGMIDETVGAAADEQDFHVAYTCGADPAAMEIYFEKLTESLPTGFRLNGWNVHVDAAHGAAWSSTPELLRRLGANVSAIGITPDGRNINESCGSLFPQVLSAQVRDAGRGIGICHDGDADRMILIDEEGVPLDGDEILAILGLHRLRQDRLPHHALVATVMSNLGLDAAMAADGGRVVRTAVGDRNVMEAMAAGGYVLGGEQSGHILLPDFLPTGDGLMASLHVMSVMKETGRRLVELRQWMEKFPQKLWGVAVREKRALEQMPAVAAAVFEAEAALDGRGRVFFRYSGTENKARLLLEGPDAGELQRMGENILQCLHDEVGVEG